MPSTLTDRQRIEQLERNLGTLAELTKELSEAHLQVQEQLLVTLDILANLKKAYEATL